MIEKLSEKIKDDNYSRATNSKDFINKINEIIEHINNKQRRQEQTYTLTETQLLKILAFSGHATYSTSDIDSKMKKHLIYMSDEIQWDIADMLNIDINEEYINPFTLEFEKI